MTIKLSKAGQRTAALLILLGVLGTLFSATVLPVLLASANYRESIDDLDFRMQKYRRIAAMEEPLKRQATRLQSQHMAREDLLSGESTAITGANLQELFKQRVRQSGGRLQSTQILSESYHESLERIPSRHISREALTYCRKPSTTSNIRSPCCSLTISRSDPKPHGNVTGEPKLNRHRRSR